MNKQYRWQDITNIVLGVWLFLSPFFGVIQTGTVAAWNAHLAGVVVVVISAWALVQPKKWEEWVNAIVGLWVLLSPFLLGFASQAGALWNHVIVGIVIGGDALWALYRQSETKPGRTA